MMRAAVVVGAAGAGHVRAVWSERRRGHAAPLDLMRAHCRAVNGAAMRRRLRDAFAGYLAGDDCGGREVAPAFSPNRADYEPGLCQSAITGGGVPMNTRGIPGEGFSGPLDAPLFMAAGCCKWYASEWFEAGGFGGSRLIYRPEAI